MAEIILDARRIKAYEDLKMLCRYAGESQTWCDALWKEMIMDAELFQEFVYYLEHHMLSEQLKCHGYSLIDLYVWQMDKDNLIHDTGKNTAACNKEKMILHSFAEMAAMKKDPLGYLKKLNEGRGMDQTG